MSFSGSQRKVDVTTSWPYQHGSCTAAVQPSVVVLRRPHASYIGNDALWYLFYSQFSWPQLFKEWITLSGG